MTTTTAEGHHDVADHHHDEHHALPLWLLVGTWLALMSLTGLTVFSAQFDLGAFDLPVAMAIATVKATLVMFIFMHLGFDKPFHSLLILGSFLFVFLFVSFALIDRGQYDPDIRAKDRMELGQ